MLRRSVTERLGDVAPGAFLFHAPRCDRLVRGVFRRIAFSAVPARQAEVSAWSPGLAAPVAEGPRQA